MSRRPTKAQIVRLQRMLDRMDHEESCLQSHYGAASPGSTRAVKRLDAEAIRRVLAFLAEAVEPWESSPINHRTGRPWTLADDELQPALKALEREELATPESARAFLHKHGFITKSGKMARRYGG